jgi:hypothetical protein
MKEFDHSSSTEKKNDQVWVQDQDNHRTKELPLPVGFTGPEG